MNLEVMILSPEFMPLGYINQMTALRWKQSFLSFGDFDLWCPLTPENAGLLQEQNLVWIGTEEIGVIEGVRKTKDSDGSLGLQISGRFNECWLERRIVWDKYSGIHTPFTHIRNLVTDNAISPSDPNRKIPFLRLMDEPDPSGDPVSFSAHRTNLWSSLEGLGSSHRLSIKLNSDVPNKISRLSIRKGTDRSREQSLVPSVVISSELSDILESEYTADSTSSVNMALIAGQGEGTARKTTIVNGGYSGLNRRELYVDARDISDTEPWDYTRTTEVSVLKQDTDDESYKVRTKITTVFVNRRTGESKTESSSSIEWSDTYPETGTTKEAGVEDLPIPDDVYAGMLAERGRAKLAENARIEAFNSQVRMQGARAYTYGIDYFLGDRITVEDTDLLIQISTEVSEVEQTWDDQSYSVILTLGNSAPTITQLVKRRS